VTRTVRRQRTARVRRFRLVAILGVLGPGLIAANAGNDAGGIATYASAGSQFVYRTLFVLVLVTVALVLVQEMSARLGAHTGEGLMSLIREQFSIRLATFAIVCIVVANVGLAVSEFAGIGAAFELFGVPRQIAVPVAAIAILGLVVLGSYRYAERVFLLLSLAFLAYPLAMVLGNPDWGLVATNTVWPHLEPSNAFLVLCVALIGTTITPYMQLYQASAVADRGIGPAEYRTERVDAIGGAIFACLVSMCIVIATAAAIGGHGPLDSAEQAASALRPVAGSGAEALFAFGLVGASGLAAAVVPLSTSYGLTEVLGAERSVSRRLRDAPLFYGIFAVQIVIGAAVALIPGNLFALLLGMQLLNGLITPILLTFILVLANRRSVLGAAANTPRFRLAATVCVVVVSVLAVTVVLQQVGGRLP
jgi:Mn2+/Fe2+ NRAMP family transporter